MEESGSRDDLSKFTDIAIQKEKSIEEISCDEVTQWADKMAEEGEKGKSIEPLVTLNLDECESLPRWYAETDIYINLITVSFCNMGLTTLEGFPKLRNLKKLVLADNRLSGTLELLSGCRVLSLLDLSGNNFRDFATLEPLKYMTELKYLNLNRCEVSRVDGYRGVVFGIIPSLRYVDCKRNFKNNDTDDISSYEDEKDANELGDGEVGDNVYDDNVYADDDDFYADDDDLYADDDDFYADDNDFYADDDVYGDDYQNAFFYNYMCIRMICDDIDDMFDFDDTFDFDYMVSANEEEKKDEEEEEGEDEEEEEDKNEHDREKKEMLIRTIDSWDCDGGCNVNGDDSNGDDDYDDDEEDERHGRWGSGW